MATTMTQSQVSKGVHRAVWSLAGGEVGDEAAFPGATDVSIQVTGTPGTITIQGSNEATASTWATLQEPDGTALVITTAGIYQLEQNVAHIRPSQSGGSTSSVIILFKTTV